MQNRLTLEEVARIPRPGMAIPGALQFSPDGRLLTYLYSPEGGLVRQLYALEIETGARRLLVQPPGEGATEANLSLEEKLRRERARQHELGVTSYTWSPTGGCILIPQPDGLYVQDLPEDRPAPGLRKLVSAENGPVIDPRFSPDGQWVAFVQADEVWVASVDGSTPPVQRTSGAQALGRTHGLAEYIAQEEMDRREGFWWSPDSRRIAFEEVDETHIPVYRIVHQGQDAVGEGAQEDHRYPFAGGPNARVRLGVVDARPPAEGGPDAPVWMDLGEDADFYLARVQWGPDGRLLAQVENREQTRLNLLRLDPVTGAAERVLVEENPVWVNLHNMLRPIRRGPWAGCFLWASERSGFRHLYLYDTAGRLLRPITAGDWMVDSLDGVDETGETVYFTATAESPLEAHLYAASLAEDADPSAPRRITQAAGMHSVVIDPRCRRFADTHQALDTPPGITLRALPGGEQLQRVYENDDPRIAALDLRPPDLVTLTSRDGVTLYGAIYRPDTGTAPYPTIVSVYGGPHAQMVDNSWRMTVDLRAQYLRALGFLVFKLDNRGSARRGLEFEGALKRHMGGVEVRDQEDGLRWLAEQGLADPQRAGIYGWSYGGYMALMCLAGTGENAGGSTGVFRAAVAGAPVTAWDGYDTHYTERYMGTPQSNPDGYRASSPIHRAADMRGRLMIVHGLIDENVQFRHTARMINGLIAARKTYDLLLFPDERHSPRRLGDRVFMEEQIARFFQRELMGEKE